MGVALSEDEAWAFVAGSRTGILTTLRRDGFPVALPIWFVAIDREVYFRTPATSRKIARIRRDGRAGFLVEAGERWRDLTAVSFSATAALVEDPAERDAVLAARAAKYEGLGSGGRAALPAASVAHYSGAAAIVRLTPRGRLITWDNAKVRLRATAEGS